MYYTIFGNAMHQKNQNGQGNHSFSGQRSQGNLFLWLQGRNAPSLNSSRTIRIQYTFISFNCNRFSGPSGAIKTSFASSLIIESFASLPNVMSGVTFTKS